MGRARNLGRWVAVAGLLLAGCGPGDVVLVTVDTLRADRVGLYGYSRATTPQIDRWFRDGAIYLRAYSPEANTPPSVASILTGRLPQDHRVRLFYQLLPDDIETIPELLPWPYQSAAFVSNIVLTDEAMGLADRFDHYDDFVTQSERWRPRVYERTAERTTDATLAWLETESDPERPLFLWVHYIDPHGPYRAPGSWRRRFQSEPRPIPIDRIPPLTREPGVNDGSSYVDRYDSEIAYVDAEIGRLLDGYAVVRNAEAALLLLTADHGESMMEHDFWFNHGISVFEEMVRVPMLLRGPGVVAGRFATPVSGVDVARTVLAHAGVAAPDGMGGRDLRDPAGLDPERVVFTEANDSQRLVRAIVRGSEKALVTFDREGGEVAEVFDLSDDPAELSGRPLDPEEPLARILLEKIEADPDPLGIPAHAERGFALKGPKIDPRASDEALEALRQLGYAE